MLICKFSTKNIDSKLDKFSKQIGFEIPIQLKEFLNKYNGGETPSTEFNIRSISSDIVGFYGVGNVKYSYNKINVFYYKSSIFLPIAFDDVLIDLKTGKIYFEDHESNDVVKLTNTLKEFIEFSKENLRACSEDEFANV